MRDSADFSDGVKSATARHMQSGWQVDLNLSPAGRQYLQTLTRTRPHRGQRDASSAGPNLQHFAAIIGDQIISVPQIDYRSLPDGIILSGGGGVVIAGGFNHASAHQLAALINAAPPQIKLTTSHSGA